MLPSPDLPACKHQPPGSPNTRDPKSIHTSIKPAAKTKTLPLPGSVGLDSDDQLRVLAQKLEEVFEDTPMAQHLAYKYGTRVEALTHLCKQDPSLKKRIVEDLPYAWVEIEVAAQQEMAYTVADALVRRTQLYYRDQDHGLGVVDETAHRMGKILGWSSEECARQIQDYKERVATNRQWRRQPHEQLAG